MSILAAVPFPLQITAVLFLGLTLGSFVNVCFHRLPEKESVITPRSRCLSCKGQVAAWDNIPVFSYLLLKGKCRQCTVPISILYPIIELVTAFLILFGFIKFGVSWEFMIFCVIAPALLIIITIDIKHQSIPDIITIPGIVFGLAAGSYLVGLKDSSLGLISGGGTFIIVSTIFYWVRGLVGMGGGDIKFIAAVGALLGVKQVFLVIFISAFMGSLVGLSGLALKKINTLTVRYFHRPIPFGTFLEKINSLSPIPFGAFLAGGTLIAYFSGERIIHLYIMMVTGGY